MSQHTKGPWGLFPCPGKPDRLTIGPVESHSNLVRAVALVYRDTDEDLANARLIAAAPKMVDLLEKLAHYTKAAWAHNAEEQRAAFAIEARALLARIKEGEK